MVCVCVCVCVCVRIHICRGILVAKGVLLSRPTPKFNIDKGNTLNPLEGHYAVCLRESHDSMLLGSLIPIYTNETSDC